MENVVMYQLTHNENNTLGLYCEYCLYKLEIHVFLLSTGEKILQTSCFVCSS